MKQKRILVTLFLAALTIVGLILTVGAGSGDVTSGWACGNTDDYSNQAALPFERATEVPTKHRASTAAPSCSRSLSGSYLAGENLRGAPLRFQTLRGTYLVGADLTDADLRGADLTLADLRGAILVGVDLRGATLKWTNLVGSRLCHTLMPDGSTCDRDCSADLKSGNSSCSFLRESTP